MTPLSYCDKGRIVIKQVIWYHLNTIPPLGGEITIHIERVPKMAPKSNNPATTSHDNDAIRTQPPTPFQMMLRAMANDASAEDGNFGGDDLNAILSAETEEELFESDERPPLNFQHLAGCEIAVLAFDVKFSRRDNDKVLTPFVWTDNEGKEKKMYLLVKAVRISSAGEKSVIKLPPIGEVFTANTSARFVVAKLWRAMTLGLIDDQRAITWECAVQETDLGDGTGVLKLRPIPKRATRATVE